MDILAGINPKSTVISPLASIASSCVPPLPGSLVVSLPGVNVINGDITYPPVPLG